METAEQKDSLKSVWSHVTKRATLVLSKYREEWGRTMVINFVLLRSPVFASRDPDTIVVSQEFSASPSLPEILWNFSHYEGRARITLEQNPHFYSHLPADESAYTPMFRCHPLQDASMVLEYNCTVYVLVEGPSRVFLNTERDLRIFGNVWSLNGALIFRGLSHISHLGSYSGVSSDRFGVLEGEQLVRGSSVRGDLWYCEQPVVSNDCKSHSLSNHRCLHPIVTASSADPPAWGRFEDWVALNRRASRSISIHVYGSGGSPESVNSLDLPPHPPTSELPGYPVQYTNINTLDNDVLLFIFSYYRLDEENGWNTHLGWCKLAHVCRRWRHFIHFSAFRLGMHILCTNGTPIVDTLDHLPSPPLFIDYRDTPATITRQDELAIRHALLLRDRVRHIDLHLPSSILHMFLPLVDRPFSTLEYLSLSHTNGGDSSLVLPKTFLAPNIRHLMLLGVKIPKRLRLLTSTVSLVTLVLTNIRESGYFLPRLLAARLQSLPQLENLSIGFSVPIPRPSAERELLSNRGATVTLPNVKHLVFQGVSAYLECFVAQIRTPRLERLDITLFYQMAFELPHLSHFTNMIEGLKFPIAKVSFGHDSVSVVTHDTQQHSRRFSFHVMCRPMDWQIDCAAQICSALMPALLGVRDLKLIFYEEMMPTEWQNGEIDGTTWHELLRAFVRTKELHICAALSQELSRALHEDDVGSDPGLLPDLREIMSEFQGTDLENLFRLFLHARRIAGNPVRYQPSTYKARAVHGYIAAPDKPNEISFFRDDILTIVDKTGEWWQAEKEDGTRGILPSSFVQIIEQQQSARSSFLSYISDSDSSDKVHPRQARALFGYAASADDPTEISFSKGEILDIFDSTGKYWKARKQDGTLGTAPSNYLQII